MRTKSNKPSLQWASFSKVAHSYSRQRRRSLETVFKNYRQGYTDGRFTLKAAFHTALHLSFLTTLGPTALFISVTIFVFGWGLFTAGILTMEHGFLLSFICGYIIGRIAGHFDANVVQPLLNFWGFNYPVILLVGCVVSGSGATLLFQVFEVIIGTRFLSCSDEFAVFLTSNIVFYMHYAVQYGPLMSFASTSKEWKRDGLNDLLPHDKRGDIISLTAQGHYVKVHTSRGEWEIRMKFAQALELVSQIEGLQVHRSHWVAAGYIKDLSFKQRRWVVCLGSHSIPVSATYVCAVRELLSSRAALQTTAR